MIRLRVFLGEAENVTTNYVRKCFRYFFFVVERDGEKWRGRKLKLRVKGRNLVIVSC